MTKPSSTESKAINLAAIEAELRDKSPDQVASVFWEAHAGAVPFIARAAVAVKLLVEWDYDVSGIPMVKTYMDIARGRILPEVAWAFAEAPASVRQGVCRLPVEVQEKLAANPVVEVVEPTPGGGFTTREVDLTKAPASVAKQVIGDAGVRSRNEQVEFLGSAKHRQDKPTSTIEDAVDEPFKHEVTVHLTASEYEAIRVHAARMHTKEWRAIRILLREAGAFKSPVVKSRPRSTASHRPSAHHASPM